MKLSSFLPHGFQMWFRGESFGQRLPCGTGRGGWGQIMTRMDNIVGTIATAVRTDRRPVEMGTRPWYAASVVADASGFSFCDLLLFCMIFRIPLLSGYSEKAPIGCCSSQNTPIPRCQIERSPVPSVPILPSSAYSALPAASSFILLTSLQPKIAGNRPS